MNGGPDQHMQCNALCVMKAVSVDDSSPTLSKQTCCLQSGAEHVALGLPDCVNFQITRGYAFNLFTRFNFFFFWEREGILTY